MHNTVNRKLVRNFLNFFLTKMIIGIGVIVSLVAIIELFRSFILDKTNLSDDVKALIVSVVEAFIATAGYIVLFRAWDKRRIHELNREKFLRYAVVGSLTGMVLQALFILVIYLAGTFLVTNIK